MNIIPIVVLAIVAVLWLLGRALLLRRLCNRCRQLTLRYLPPSRIQGCGGRAVKVPRRYCTNCSIIEIWDRVKKTWVHAKPGE
jgi:hypothetical protein